MGNAYYETKEYISDIFNGEVDDYDLDELEERIEQLFQDEEINESQYEELLGYLREL